jgi:hypothetical protein
VYSRAFAAAPNIPPTQRRHACRCSQPFGGALHELTAPCDSAVDTKLLVHLSEDSARTGLRDIQAAAAFADSAHRRQRDVPKGVLQREAQLIGSGAVPPVQPPGPSSGPLVAASGEGALFGCGNPAGHFVDVS